jgi:hypothetical protein
VELAPAADLAEVTDRLEDALAIISKLMTFIGGDEDGAILAEEEEVSACLAKAGYCAICTRRLSVCRCVRTEQTVRFLRGLIGPDEKEPQARDSFYPMAQVLLQLEPSQWKAVRGASASSVAVTIYMALKRLGVWKGPPAWSFLGITWLFQLLHERHGLTLNTLVPDDGHRHEHPLTLCADAVTSRAPDIVRVLMNTLPGPLGPTMFQGKRQSVLEVALRISSPPHLTRRLIRRMGMTALSMEPDLLSTAAYQVRYHWAIQRRAAPALNNLKALLKHAVGLDGSGLDVCKLAHAALIKLLDTTPVPDGVRPTDGVTQARCLIQACAAQVKSHRRALFTTVGTTVTPLMKGIHGLVGLVAAYTMPRVEEMHPDALARADAKDAEERQVVERLSQQVAQFAVGPHERWLRDAAVAEEIAANSPLAQAWAAEAAAPDPSMQCD